MFARMIDRRDVQEVDVRPTERRDPGSPGDCIIGQTRQTMCPHDTLDRKQELSMLLLWRHGYMIKES